MLRIAAIAVLLMIAVVPDGSSADRTVKLLTLEWVPYVSSEMYN